MRRSLVLTDDRARQSFLASLPPHIRRGEESRPIKRAGPTWQRDLRDFLMAYCACFIAVSLYIA